MNLASSAATRVIGTLESDRYHSVPPQPANVPARRKSRLSGAIVVAQVEAPPPVVPARRRSATPVAPVPPTPKVVRIPRDPAVAAAVAAEAERKLEANRIAEAEAAKARKAIEAKAVARAERAKAEEARRLAEVEAERLRMEADAAARKLAADLTNLAKQPVVIAPAPPVPKPAGKKGAFNVLDHLRQNAGKPVEPVASCPSKERLAALEQEMNPQKEPAPYFWAPLGTKDGATTTVPASVVAQRMQAKPLIERIKALVAVPQIVLNVYRGKVTRWRWETVDAMLAVSASDKDANVGLTEFVTRCEAARAKRT